MKLSLLNKLMMFFTVLELLEIDSIQNTRIEIGNNFKSNEIVRISQIISFHNIDIYVLLRQPKD